MRSEGPDFNCEAHRNGRRVPTRCRESFEYCFLSGGFIKWNGCGSNSAANRLISSLLTETSPLLKRIPNVRSSDHSIIFPSPSAPRHLFSGQESSHHILHFFAKRDVLLAKIF